MVKAIQEEQEIIDRQDRLIAELQSAVTSQDGLIAELQSAVTILKKEMKAIQDKR